MKSSSPLARAFRHAVIGAALFVAANLTAHAETTVAETPDALLKKAIAERQAGDKDSALEHLERAAKLAPTRTDVLFELGTLAGELSGQRSSISLAFEARNSLEKAVELAPDYKAARAWLIGFYSGAPFFAGGSMKKAHKHADILSSQDPWTGFYWKHKLLMDEKEYGEAFKLCDSMLSKAPTSVLARFQFGMTSAASGKRLTEGKSLLESCLAEPAQPNQPSHDQICLQLGLIEEKLGHKPQAIAVFEKGLQLNPQNKGLEENLKRLR